MPHLRRTTIAAALLTVGSLMPVHSASAVELSPPGEEPDADPEAAFTLFDNTGYPNAHLAENYGMPKAGVVYDYWGIECGSTSCTLPTEPEYKEKLAEVAGQAPPNSPLALDYEAIDFVSGTPDAEKQQALGAWKTLIDWTRDVIGPSRPLGHYNYDWDWSTTDIELYKELHTDGRLTFFAPSMYDRWSSPAEWAENLNRAVANDRAVAPDQPIYPYIWPQHYDDETFKDAATWTNELEQLRGTVQGAMVWSGTATLTSSSCGWIAATHNFQIGNGSIDGSTGPLTVDAEFPETCRVRFGTTTTVPVSITNTAGSTTAATTLDISGPTGFSGTPASSSVPELAPGESWSTTVDITVFHDSARTGDAILEFRLGDYVQKRTVVAS